MLPFLRYALLSVLRNRRRSIYAMIGIALALSMITGSFIAVDSSSVGMLKAAVQNVPVDFLAERGPWNGTIDPVDINETVAAIKSVKYVENSTPIVVQYGLTVRNAEDNVTYVPLHGAAQVVMVPDGQPRFSEAFKITGSVPSQGTVAISRQLADSLQLGIGDPLELQGVRLDSIFDENGTFIRVDTFYLNLSFEVSQIWTQDLPAIQKEYTEDPLNASEAVVIRDMVNPVIMNFTDAPELLEEMMLFGSSWQFLPSQLYFYVWVDQDSVISIADIPGTVSRLQYIHNRLSLVGQSHDLYIEDSELVGPLQSLDPQLTSLKGLALVLSLPVIALGVYLSLVGVDLGTTGRRREVGILKSRGARTRQVFGALMLESAFVGVIASAMGLLLGIVVSRFLLGAVTTFGATSSTMEDSASWTDLRISVWTVLLSILLGIALMLLSTYRPFKRVSQSSVSQALHHYSPISTQTSHNPWVDVIFVGVSALSIVSVFVGMDAAYGRGFSWLTEILLTIVLVTGVVLFPIMPFFLSMGIVRLMTMGSHRLYARLTFFVKPWTKELTYLVNRNIVRNPRRAANLGVIISLALAFGLFISVTMESTFAQEREVVKYDVGSDVNLSGKSGYWQPVSYAKLAKVDTLRGVEHASHYVVLSSSAYFGPTTLAILNSTDYLSTVDPGNFYFVDQGSNVLNDLTENNTCLLSKQLADEYDILVGDELEVQLAWVTHDGDYQFTRINLQLSVIGIVKALPGLTYCSIFIDSRTVSYVPFGNMSASEALLGVFLKTSGGADPREVASAALAVFASSNVNGTASVFQDRLDALGEDPTYRAISDFLYTQYVLALLIMSVGVGLIIFVAVNDREHELACIMARGSSKSQMRRMLMGESISLMSLGLLVGVSVGILTAYLFNTLWGTESAMFDKRMVFTGISWLVLAASVGSLLVASLLATSRAGKVRLAEVLRIRGG